MKNRFKHLRFGREWWPEGGPDYFKKLVWRGAWVIVAVVVICWYIAQFARGGGL